MTFRQTNISGVWVIEPTFYADDRGRFFRAWCSREFAEHGINFLPVQCTNMGFSNRRGRFAGCTFRLNLQRKPS